MLLGLFVCVVLVVIFVLLVWLALWVLLVALVLLTSGFISLIDSIAFIGCY